MSLRFSRSAKTYDRWALPQRECAQKLVDLVKPWGRILDVGCGTGFVSSFVDGRGSVLGVDISEGMVCVYRERFGVAVLGDVESLPFRDSSFDWVLSNFTLHWTDLSKSLREILRVARVGAGIALPVEGSLEGFGFPFPKVEEVLERIPSVEEVRVEEVRIPFSGWDLVRFFHFTGTSLNPRRRKVMSRVQIEDLLVGVGEPRFRVLFLYARRL